MDGKHRDSTFITIAINKYKLNNKFYAFNSSLFPTGVFWSSRSGPLRLHPSTFDPNTLDIILSSSHLRGDGSLGLLGISSEDLLLTLTLGGGSLGSLEGLLKVGNDVVDMLNTD